MARCRIGFYVHHHGRGHATRCALLLPHLSGPAWVLGTDLTLLYGHPQARCVPLPSDMVPVERRGVPPEPLHYAPLGALALRQRVLKLVQTFAEAQLNLLVVDVSVEVALLARLCGLPTVYARQHGARHDPPHRAAYQSAEALLAPYPAWLEDPDLPTWVREKTFYAGGFCRDQDVLPDRTSARRRVGMATDGRHVLVAAGFGGSGHALTDVAAAARATPDWQWWVVGPTSATAALPDNLRLVGVVDRLMPYLRAADVVVGAAGNNLVTEVAAAGTPFVCLPEPRPFDEQQRKAAALARVDAALVLATWPAADAWPGLLAAASHTDVDRLRQIVAPDGAARAAHFLEETAQRARRDW